MQISPLKSSFRGFCVLFILVLSLVSCKQEPIKVDDNTVFNEIKAVFDMQEKAWNSGDIDAFMKGYWNNEQMTFVGSRGVDYGWQTTLANYKKNYPNLESMGILSFEINKLERLAEDVCFMIGKFTLQRKEDAPSGYFTLIWKKVDGRWVITSDHTG